MNTLENEVALVTGGNRGIGRAISLAFAKAGADVIVNFHKRADEAAEVDRLVSESEQQLGGITILVNNAGIARPQPIEEITEADWDDLIDVNLKSCFLVTQRVLPGMRARHYGRVINRSSVAAAVGGVVGPHYAASKAGMLGLTRYYASKLAVAITAGSNIIAFGVVQ